MAETQGRGIFGLTPGLASALRRATEALRVKAEVVEPEVLPPPCRATASSSQTPLSSSNVTNLNISTPKPTLPEPAAKNIVKQEPQNDFTPLTSLSLDRAETEDTEPVETRAASVPIQINQQPTERHPFIEYSSVTEINYTPEEALKHGLAMVAVIKDITSKLQVASKLRKDVWLREIKKLETTGAQSTLIALCGATGSGKSSVINALLQDNIVPTSGMRACTATVTEIRYHDHRTIEAQIEFLSREEWRAELEVLLHDFRNDDGSVMRPSDMRGDAAISWQKVHAVYPRLSPEVMITMAPDAIIDSDVTTAKRLDTLKKLVCTDSKQFSGEINKYIDSKDQRKKKKKNPYEPSLWPLIRQVRVWVKADALSTGAVLIDLPGCADANVARSNIAKDYLKIANCIWILAPIHRAVDDKTAKDLLGEAFKSQLLMDGNYDDNCVTFIATKADDIAPSEIVRALELEDEPTLVTIEANIKRFKHQVKESKALKTVLGKDVEMLNKQLVKRKKILAELEDHLNCIQAGRTFVPKLTSKEKKLGPTNPKKRKATGTGRKDSIKRHHKAPSDGVDDFIVDDFIEDDMISEDINTEGCLEQDSELSATDSDKKSISDFVFDSDSDMSDMDTLKQNHKSMKTKTHHHNASEEESYSEDDDEMISEIVLEENIVAAKVELDQLRQRLSKTRDEKNQAAGEASTAEKKLVAAQKEKNGFCATKRAEWSHSILKQDFRNGLRELDEAAAQERDGKNFDPNVAFRDYAAINLPTFCVSARDYGRIHKLNNGDGESSTFTNDSDTEIPQLQEWCKSLTVSTREKAAKSFIESIKVFAKSILSFINGVSGVSAVEKEALRAIWESPDSNTTGDLGLPWLKQELDVKVKVEAPRRNVKGGLIGIVPRLRNDFRLIKGTVVEELRERFKDGLEDKCTQGATQAAAAAVKISDEFAASIPWQTYRATLRRDGAFRQDLNELLCAPLTKNIAHSWSKVFDSDLFSIVERRALSAIHKLLKDIENSTRNVTLQDSCRLQGEEAIEEAKVEIHKLVAIIEDLMQSKQKDISRCIAPTVRGGLKDGYLDATSQHGIGSVLRQKNIFHDYVERVRHDIFRGGTENVLKLLENAAVDVGESLENALCDLAKKVEVNIAVIWEGAKDSAEQLSHRTAAVDKIHKILYQLALWSDAEAGRDHLHT